MGGGPPEPPSFSPPRPNPRQPAYVRAALLTGYTVKVSAPRSAQPFAISPPSNFHPAITFHSGLGWSSQASQNDRRVLLYRLRPFSALFRESLPGGWGENSQNLPPEGPTPPGGSRRQALMMPPRRSSQFPPPPAVNPVAAPPPLPSSSDYETTRLVLRCFGLAASR